MSLLTRAGVSVCCFGGKGRGRVDFLLAGGAGATVWIVVLAVALCSELLRWCPAAAGCWNSPLGAATGGDEAAPATD